MVRTMRESCSILVEEDARWSIIGGSRVGFRRAPAMTFGRQYVFAPDPRWPSAHAASVVRLPD